MRVRRPSDRKPGKMLRGMRARIGSGIDHHIAQAVERRPYGRSGKRAAGKLRVEKFKNEMFGEAQQIGLWPFTFARPILGNRTEQHGNAVAAGFFHRAVMARAASSGESPRADS